MSSSEPLPLACEHLPVQPVEAFHQEPEEAHRPENQEEE